MWRLKNEDQQKMYTFSAKILKSTLAGKTPPLILFSLQNYQFFISLRFGLWKAGPGVSYGEWNDGPKLNGRPMPQLFLLNSERNPCLKIILPPQLAKDGINSFATMTKLFYNFVCCGFVGLGKVWDGCYWTAYHLGCLTSHCSGPD